MAVSHVISQEAIPVSYTHLSVMKKRKIVLILACCLTLSGCTRTEKSTVNIDQGNVSLEQGYYQEALGSFQTALDAGEDLVQSYRGEGIAYMGIENYAAAIQMCIRDRDCTIDRIF